MKRERHSRRALLAGIASLGFAGVSGCLRGDDGEEDPDVATVDPPVVRLDSDGTTLRYANLSHVGRVTAEPFEATTDHFVAEYTDAPCFEGGFDGSGSHVAVTSCDGPELFTDGERTWNEHDGTMVPPRIVDGTAYFPGRPIRAVDVERATQRWRTFTPTSTVLDLAVGDDMLVQCTHEGLFAVETSGGERRWHASRERGFDEVALGEDTLWALGRSDTDGDSLVGIAIEIDSGEVRQTVDIDTDSPAGSIERDETGPLILSDGVLRAFADDGTRRWQFGGDDDDLGELTVTDDAVYVADSETTYEISPEEGRERRRWNYSSDYPPAVGDEWLYLLNFDAIRRVPLTGPDSATA